MDIEPNLVELMSPSRYRTLAKAGLAGMLNSGTKRVYTPDGWAKVVLVEEGLEQEMRGVANQVYQEFLEE